MTAQEKPAFFLDNPAYQEAYRYLQKDMPLMLERMKMRKLITMRLEKALGIKTDPDSFDTNIYLYDLGPASNDVAWNVCDLIEGSTIVDFPLDPRNKKKLRYKNNFGRDEIIETGDRREYSYVVDKEKMVWDPITRNWGTMKNEEFHKRLYLK